MSIYAKIGATTGAIGLAVSSLAGAPALAVLAATVGMAAVGYAGAALAAAIMP